MTAKYAILTFTSLIFISCSDDTCSLHPVDDENATLSLTGKVININTAQGEPDVPLSLIDQLGGTFIINWDSTKTTNTEGCFRFLMERDQEYLQELLDMSPDLSVDLINQSFRPHGTEYFYHFSVQGNDTIYSFSRHRYDSDRFVEMFVSPSADISFNFDPMNELGYGFRWSFEDPILSKYNTTSGFSLDYNTDWFIPTGQEVRILVEFNRDEIILDTVVIASPASSISLSF